MATVTKKEVEEKIELLNFNFGFDIEMIKLDDTKFVLKAVDGEVILGRGTLYQINFFLQGIQQGVIMDSNPIYTKNVKKMNKPVYPNSKFPVGLNGDRK